MRSRYTGLSVIVLILLVATAAGSWQEIKAFAQEQGWMKRTEQEKFQVLLTELETKRGYLSDVDLAFDEDFVGTEIVTEIGLKAIHRTLIDSYSAKFENVVMAHNPERREVNVCGLVNAKNRLGAYVGYTPFSVPIRLAETAGETTAGLPWFKQDIREAWPLANREPTADFFQDYYKDRCGAIFMLEAMQRGVL